MEILSPRRRTRGGLLALGAALAAVIGVVLAAVFGGPGQAGADPPGNNGTVKVDGVVFDDDPNNEPHVDCIFQIDWYASTRVISSRTSRSRCTRRPASR
jgi:hypothetical protein